MLPFLFVLRTSEVRIRIIVQKFKNGKWILNCFIVYHYSILLILCSQWANVFPPCEQFLRRLWTMTGSQVKGGAAAAQGGASNEGEYIMCFQK